MTTSAPPGTGAPDSAKTAATVRAPAARRAPSRTEALFGGAFAVLERDFLGATSRGSFVMVRTLVVTLVSAAAVVVISVSSLTGVPVNGGNLFLATACGTLGLCALLGPAIAADSIAGERSSDTLPLVLAAPVTPLGFVLAKFVARFAALLVPLAGTIPVTAAALLYGGASGEMLLDYVVFLLLIGVMTTSASLLASAYARGVAGAATGGYVIGLLLPAAELFPLAWFCHEALRLSNRDTIDVLAHNPFFAIGQAIDSKGRSIVLWQSAVLVVVLSCAALWLATRRLEREFAVTERSRRVRTPRAVRFEDPVLHRVTPRRIWAPDDWASAFGFVLTGAVAWFAPVAGRWDDDEILGSTIAATWLVAFFVLIRASQAFAADRPRGTLALVLAAPMPSSAVWRAHLLGVLCHAARLLVPVVALVVIATADGEIRPGAALGWTAATCVLLPLLACFGLWRSAVSATGGKAVASTLGWFIGASVAFGALVAGAMWTVDKLHGDEDDVGIFLSALTPPGWHGMLTVFPQDDGWNSEERLGFFTSLVSCGASLALCVPLRFAALRGLAEDPT